MPEPTAPDTNEPATPVDPPKVEPTPIPDPPKPPRPVPNLRKGQQTAGAIPTIPDVPAPKPPAPQIDLTLKKVNLGCGDKLLPGYINVDLESKGATVTADIREFEPPQAVDEVIAIHVIEHLDRDEATALLKKIHGYMAPDGLLIVEMPERDKVLSLLADPQAWRLGLLGLLGDRTDESGKIDGDFVRWREDNREALTDLARQSDFAGIVGMIPDQWRREGQQHVYLWSDPEFLAALRDAGFQECRVASPETHGNRDHRDSRWIGKR